MSRRVVVTGLGVTTPIGTGVAKFWKALIAGCSGIDTIRAFDASALRVRIAGEVKDLAPESRLSAKTIKRSARFTQLGLIAALEAVEHPGLPNDRSREDVAVVV